MIKHRYYYFHNIFYKGFCDCTKSIIHEFFHFFFEGFIYMQFQINHICNHKLVNILFCIIKINKFIRQMQYRQTIINPQQWQYWKMIKIIPFIFVNSFLFSFPNSITFCSRVLTVLIIYWMTLVRQSLANKCLSVLVLLNICCF